MEVLDKIRSLQRDRGWTEAKLAEKAGLPPTTVNSLFRNNNLPTIPTLTALCQAFGITLSQFFADANLPLDLTPGQRELLEAYNALTEPRQRALVQLAKAIK